MWTGDFTVGIRGINSDCAISATGEIYGAPAAAPTLTEGETIDWEVGQEEFSEIEEGLRSKK